MESEKKSNGALVGLIVIIIILILGGIYIWRSNKNARIEGSQVQNNAVTTQDSAELDALGQDLNTADTNLDTGIVDSLK